MCLTIRLKDFIKDDFPLAVLYSGLHAEQPVHSHDFQELVVVLDGSCLHTSGESSYRIEAGDVFVIAGNDRHGYSKIEGMRLVNILFDFAGLDLPLQDLRSLPGFLMLFELEPKLRSAHKFKSRLRLAFPELRKAEKLLFRMMDELNARAPGYKAICVGLLLELITTISRFCPQELSPERKELRNLGWLLKWMEEHHASRMTLASLAKQAGMSKRNFQRIFKEAVGESPIQRLLKIRLEKAEKDLREFSLSIGELALRNGFYDGNYFAKQFIKANGLTPVGYRKLHHVKGRR